MSKIQQEPELNLISVETVSVKIVLDPVQNLPEGIRHDTETCSITTNISETCTNTTTLLQTPIRQRSHSITSVNIPVSTPTIHRLNIRFNQQFSTPTIPNPFSTPTIHSNYNSTPMLNLDGGNNTPQLRDPLEVLNRITEICLVITAFIMFISICVVILTVGLSIMRMYNINQPNTMNQYYEPNATINKPFEFIPNVNVLN